MSEANASHGRLLTAVNIKLHTEPANSFLSSQRAGPGLLEFGRMMSSVSEDARHDNPFADYMLLQVEEAIEAIEAKVEASKNEIKEKMAEVECDAYEVVPATASIPYEQTLQFGSPYPFVVARVLREIDDLMRITLAATHIGVLSSRKRSEVMQPLWRDFRTLLSKPRTYRKSHTTRWNYGMLDATTRAAFEERVGGPVPEDVLSGARRGELAPEIVEAVRENMVKENLAQADDEEDA